MEFNLGLTASLTGGPSRSLLFGPPSARTPLERLLAHSHWTLELETDLSAFTDRLRGERFPVVFCLADDLQHVEKVLEPLDPRAKIVALVSDSRRRKNWVQTLRRNVYSVNVNPWAQSKLVPLLNHAWRDYYRCRRQTG